MDHQVPCQMQSLLGDRKNFKAACPRWIHEVVTIRLIYFCYLIVFQEKKRSFQGFCHHEEGGELLREKVEVNLGGK